MPQQQGYWTAPQVAEYLQVHVVTIRKWARDGKIPHVRIPPGGEYRFTREEIDRWLESERTSGPNETIATA